MNVSLFSNVISSSMQKSLVYLYHFCNTCDPLDTSCEARTQALRLPGFLTLN